MKRKWLVAIGIVFVTLISGCAQEAKEDTNITREEIIGETSNFPKIAGLLAKKDEIIASGKPYDLVMTAWFTPKEASEIKENNPDAILLAGLTANWVWDNEGWMTFLNTVANYGKEPTQITEDMYLHKKDGKRCAFGWASEEWGHEEIYAMDPRNEKWVEFILTFYRHVLEQPQHDGIIVDMVVEKNFWCPDAISDEEWLEATKSIYEKIQGINTQNKLVIFNAGKDFSDIDEYAEYFDGYVMENFLGEQLQTTFADGLEAANSEYIVIYGVDTDDTGIKDMARMRLGLTLSLLNDNTYFTYDFGPRDHGQAWWFIEYDVKLGKPVGAYYKKDSAYYRDFENGIVVSSPESDTVVNFDEEYTDITTNIRSTSFTIEKGDGRIYIKK